MAQRLVTALALASDPLLLIADEPTTGLDRPLVDHTLDVLRRRCDQGGAVLLITHDLAAERVADTVAVMYASHIVEHRPASSVFTAAAHPYTAALLDALQDLVEGLLQLSLLGRAEPGREPVDLTGLAIDVVAELRQGEPERAVQVVVADGLAARADPGMLRLVLENLLGNAWKFTAGRGDARIEVASSGQEEQQPAFSVRDNGVGFDMAYAEKLFEPLTIGRHPGERGPQGKRLPQRWGFNHGAVVRGGPCAQGRVHVTHTWTAGPTHSVSPVTDTAVSAHHMGPTRRVVWAEDRAQQ
ncbi:ATP-binding protein [Actinoplanes sp. NPDC089786]|uniref:ATP-binding protein n=1 Tax=Actinoplanes sp. NPDC089786 TaxID=3155185 RepID=UPI0034420703